MKLNQVTIPSRNLDISIAFYEKLGLELIVDARPHYVRLLCPEGDSTFSIHLMEDLPEESSVWIYFETEHLSQVCESLEKQGVEFIHKPKNQPWLWKEARLHDPDGNYLILFHGGENRISPPWKIKKASA